MCKKQVANDGLEKRALTCPGLTLKQPGTGTEDERQTTPIADMSEELFDIAQQCDWNAKRNKLGLRERE